MSKLSTGKGGPAASLGETTGSGKLSASLVCADFTTLPSQLEALDRGGVRCVHLDFGDGVFVRNLPLGTEIFAQLPARVAWSRECHLMLSQPLEVMHLFTPHANLVFFHIEAASDPSACIRAIRAARVRPGIALNPATPPETIVDLLHEVDDILVLAVEPGFPGAPFVSTVVEKIRRIRDLADAVSPRIRIEVDGAVSPRNIPSLVHAGADRFVGGSAGLFRGGDLEASARSLISCIEEAAARGASSSRPPPSILL